MVRLLNALASAFFLAWVAPLFAVIALLLALDGSGPVLERRTGYRRDGRAVVRLTFRVPGGPPGFGARTTWLGTLLWVTRLDELPLLISVLKGDLTLFGPIRLRFGVIYRPPHRPL